MFEQFPYTNFHELNLDWIIDQLRRTMESAVLSVNGQTGDVVLYQSENVVFPDVASPQWRMVRTADGHIAGVMFQNGLMYVMYDGTADRVYTINNPPPYPVTSVDGQTGAVQVFPNAATRLPDVQDDYTNIRRQIETNGTQNIVGIELKQNKAYRMVDNNRYEIYDADNPPPYPVTSVNGNTGAIVIAIPFEDVTTSDIEFAEASNDHYWSLGRETLDGTASIQLYTNSSTAEAYIDFYDGQGVTYTKKLLTVDDIPSASGVVSINGMNGVVTIYGDTMPIESGSPDSVKDVTDDLDTRLGTAENTITQHGTDIGTLSTGLSNTQLDIAIVENTNNATHNISAGDYVIWKGALYTASSNISIGDGLSGSNLTAVSNGGLNALNGKIALQTTDIVAGANGLIAYQIGKMVYLVTKGNGIAVSSTGYQLPNNIIPANYISAPAIRYTSGTGWSADVWASIDATGLLQIHVNDPAITVAYTKFNIFYATA